MRLRPPLLAATMLLWSLSAGAAPAPNDQVEQQFEAELQALEPRAAPAFAEANRLRSETPRRAEELYGEVIALAPGFAPAWRRRCMARLALEERPLAVQDCRRAAKEDGSAYSLGALALALAQPARPGEVSAEALQEKGSYSG